MQAKKSRTVILTNVQNGVHGQAIVAAAEVVIVVISGHVTILYMDIKELHQLLNVKADIMRQIRLKSEPVKYYIQYFRWRQSFLTTNFFPLDMQLLES